MAYKDKEERKEYDKKYYLENKEEKKEYYKKYRLEHKDESKKYYLENKDAIAESWRKWRKNKHDNDPIYKRIQQIRYIFRAIIIKIITNSLESDCIIKNRDSKCLKYFGTTADGFKKHIESQFTDTMNWHNHGNMNNPNKWQLDHIIPLGSFDFTIEENFIKAFHYTNTQPLMSSDHIEKSNKEKGKI